MYHSGQFTCTFFNEIPKILLIKTLTKVLDAIDKVKVADLYGKSQSNIFNNIEFMIKMLLNVNTFINNLGDRNHFRQANKKKTIPL